MANRTKTFGDEPYLIGKMSSLNVFFPGALSEEENFLPNLKLGLSWVYLYNIGIIIWLHPIGSQFQGFLQHKTWECLDDP